MEGKDNIKELFSQKLGNYEAKVNPELWAKISTQVAAATTTTVATGLSLFAKVAIGIGVSAAAITTVVLLSTSAEEVVSEKPRTEVQTTTSNSNTGEAKEVVEVETQETVQSKEYRDVRKYLTNTTAPSSTITAGPSSSTTTPSTQKTDQTPDLSVSEIPTRNAQSLGGGTSQPVIVEGVSHGGMSSYGRLPANQAETAPELTTPKSEPIKRFVNVFTPNGDGKNDYFELPSEGLTDFSVVVFNPEGDIVFQSNDSSFRWDGRDIRSGEIVESGTYMYMVSAYDSDGNPYPIYERLTINR